MDPLIFRPHFRRQPWGGRRLEQYLQRPLPSEEPYGEAWMLSAQALHVSVVAEGPWAGKTLSELWAGAAGELLGRTAPPSAQFPLLLKYLDCQGLLSIQVHPNDRLANELCPGEWGKTEAWIVLHAGPTARIYAGLRPGTTRESVKRCLHAGTLAECLHSFVPKKGQCVFLPAGTVHAAGGGLLMAEVQQTSDATFRLFDWNRLGPDGKARTLHVEQALASIDWSAGPVRPTAGTPLPGLAPEVLGNRLVECAHFSIDRFVLGAPWELPNAGRLSAWMVLDGQAELASVARNYCRVMQQGETVLVPASAGALRWTPRGKQGITSLLGVFLP